MSGSFYLEVSQFDDPTVFDSGSGEGRANAFAIRRIQLELVLIDARDFIVAFWSYSTLIPLIVAQLPALPFKKEPPRTAFT